MTATGVDEAAERAADRLYWRMGLVQYAFFAAWVGLAAVAAVLGDPVVGVAVFVGVYLAGDLPVLRFRARTVLRTSRSPAETRDALAGPENPVTAHAFLTADAVRAPGPDDPDATVAVAVHRSLGRDREVPVLLEERDDGSVDVSWRGGLLSTGVSTQALRPAADGTEVRATTTIYRRRPRHLLARVVGAGAAREFLDALDYAVVESDLSVGVSFR